jgi:hypothetical protein
MVKQETGKRSRRTKAIVGTALGLVAVAAVVVAVNASDAPEIVTLMVNGGALIIAFFAIEMAFIYGIAALAGRSKNRAKSQREERK